MPQQILQVVRSVYKGATMCELSTSKFLWYSLKTLLICYWTGLSYHKKKALTKQLSGLPGGIVDSVMPEIERNNYRQQRC